MTNDRFEEIWRTDDSVTYAAISTAHLVNGCSSMWLLIDYATAQTAADGRIFMSSKVLFEYDCQAQTRRVLEIQFFDQAMANGHCVFHNPKVDDPGLPIPPPGNVGYKAWKIACSGGKMH